MTGARVSRGCFPEPAYACVCLAAAVAGSFLCGIRYVPIWILLVFHSYTDARSGQIYCMPTRLCIAVDSIIYILSGAAVKDCIYLIGCMIIVMLLSAVFHMYAQGDAEVFIMLIMSAAVRGQMAVGYTINIIWLSGIVFCVIMLCANIALNIPRIGKNRKIKLIRTAPMVPSIAAAFIITCIQWKISFTAMS